MKTVFENREDNERLMKALDFDAEDLDANRHGYLSKKQRLKLSHIRRSWKWFLAVAILITPMAILYAIADGTHLRSTASSICGNTLVIVAIASGISFHCYHKVQMFNNDLLKGDVADVGGIVRRYYFAGRGQEAIHVADQVFRTNEPYRFYGFTLGGKYRIYYVPFSKYVVSAEILEQREDNQEIPVILKANPPVV